MSIFVNERSYGEKDEVNFPQMTNSKTKDQFNPNPW